MKKLVLAGAVAATVLAVVAPAGAVPTVPEPSSFVQLAAGLFVVGGLALFTRKGFSKDKAK